jgi:hypothetical protein
MATRYTTLLAIKIPGVLVFWLCVNTLVAKPVVVNSKNIVALFDTTVCGSSVVLTATSGLSNYKWSTGATTQSITVSSSGSYWWETVDYANNKVINGNFSSGNTGFISSYVVPGGPVNNTLLYPEGTYAINSNPNNVHSGFSSFYDHTTGTSSGKMMVINGASTANVTVWSENIAVAANTTYMFSVWFASAHPASPGQLNFSINGVSLGSTIQLTSTTGLWQNFTTAWTSGSGATATIGLVNQNTAATGNDFAMDDVVFAPIYHHDIVVTLNTIPVLSVTASPSSCSVYNLTTAIIGYDTATYTYVFKDSLGNVISTASAQAITQSGTYTVTETNKTTGCQSAAKTITVTINTVPAKPNVTSP